MERKPNEAARGLLDPTEVQLIARMLKQLKKSRLRLPTGGEMDSGDLVDYFNHLALVREIPCLDSPTWVNWDITRRCACECVHCAARSQFDPENAGRDETSTARALDFVDEMANDGVLTVVLSGGEPFLRKDLYVIIERLKQRRRFVTIQTSGALSVDVPQLSDLLNPETDLVQVSLDGPDAKLHDAQRGARVFDKAVSLIQRLVKSRLPVKVNTVITPANVDRVTDVFHFVRALGVPTISFTVHCPVGRGRNIPILHGDRLLRLSMELFRLAERHPELAVRNNVLLVPYAHPIVRKLVPITHWDLVLRPRCLAGTAKAVVDSRGDLYPCPFLLYPAFRAGNVFRVGLLPLWNHPATWTELRAGRRLGHTKCGRCGYLPVCRGECPGAAYGLHGTIHAPDPRCGYVPAKTRVAP